MLSSCFSSTNPSSLILWGFTSDVSKSHMEVWGVFVLFSLLVPLPYFSPFNSHLSSCKHFPNGQWEGEEFKKWLTNLMTVTATQKSRNFATLCSLLFPLLIFTSFPSLSVDIFTVIQCSPWADGSKLRNLTHALSHQAPSDPKLFPVISLVFLE